MTHTRPERERWLEARLELLEERSTPRQSDGWPTAAGAAVDQIDKSLSIRHRPGHGIAGGFVQGRSRLLIYHFMLVPTTSRAVRPAP
jgi:predicted dithiol-disulfide oxidoreductase (DUF899 family)